MATIKRSKASTLNGTTRRRTSRNGTMPGSSSRDELSGSESSGGDSSRDGAKGHKKTESLWLRYRRSRSDQTRNHLVERYRGIVEGMAFQLAGRLPRSVDVQDLSHAGMWGLMRAISSFEPERGIEFLSFMRIRVRGAMLDELRNMDYLPRLVRRRRRDFAAAESRLREELHREPSDNELAEELGVSVSILWQRFWPTPVAANNSQRARDLRAEGSSAADALDELVDDQVENPVEVLNRRDLLDKIEGSLQPLEWKVLRMHYLDGMSGREVARRLRLSASRICQIHGRVLSKLKARLGSSV